MEDRTIENTEAQRARRNGRTIGSVFSVSLCFRKTPRPAELYECLSESESLAAQIKVNLEGLG